MAQDRESIAWIVALPLQHRNAAGQETFCVADFDKGGLTLRHSLFKYYDQRIWAENFLDGEMLFRSLAYFRDCEDAVRGDECDLDRDWKDFPRTHLDS
jgi:hypothetical protein